MKLKFKADLSDVAMFILFAIFLLYVVCLAVLNFPELAINGRFFGLNPLPAFAPDRIVGTLVFYLISLAGIFMSVSSYFNKKKNLKFYANRITNIDYKQIKKVSIIEGHPRQKKRQNR